MKKALSLFLTLTMALLVFSPGITAFAAGTDAVTVTAESEETIKVYSRGELPDATDWNGLLDLSGSRYSIQRDYSQRCMVFVRNTSSKSVEYYLTVLNTYPDIYMNFIRSGSKEIPLVIAAGETQQIQLDVFAQNAENTEYRIPVYAYTVEDENETLDALTTLNLEVPTSNLDVTFTKKSEDPATLAQVFTMKNNGGDVSDLSILANDDIRDFVSISPNYSNYPLAAGETIEFTVTPDLYKMRINNLTSISGQILAVSGGAVSGVGVIFDTNGKEIISSTLRDIVNPDSEDDTVAYVIHEKTEQCTNAGKVRTTVYIPSLGAGEELESSDNSVAGKIRLFLASRMYAGGYVNREETNYDYYINGKLVSKSHNTGLTEMSLAELPIDNIKFGATNTIVRDYDTDPGSHFVTAETTIIVEYTADTPVCYLDAGEVATASFDGYTESLPDFRVNPENIRTTDTDLINGVRTNLEINVNNCGNKPGTFSVQVFDGNEKLYEVLDNSLNESSSNKISFPWTPSAGTHSIRVVITKAEGMAEMDETNNEAVHVFRARERVKPVINSITPNALAEGEKIIYASVGSYDDVTRAEFYIDGTLYSGDVDSSVYFSEKRYWINDSSLEGGAHTIRVVIYYIDADGSEKFIELSKELTVLSEEWGTFTFTFTDGLVENERPYALIYIYNPSGYRTTFICESELNGNALTAKIPGDKLVALYDAERAFACVTSLDVLYVADLKTDKREFEIKKADLQKYNLDTGNFPITYVEVSCYDFVVYLLAPTIYVTPGEYNITAYFSGVETNSLITSSYSGVKYAPQAVNEESAVKVKIPSSFDRYASVYLTGSEGDEISVADYFSGNSIKTKKDIYSANIGLNRNTGRYTVAASVNAAEQSELKIDSSFAGTISNSFSAGVAGGRVFLYLTGLKDKNGNELKEFTSGNAADNLTGEVIFTDIVDETKKTTVPVSLGSLSETEIIIPEIKGEFKVSLSLTSSGAFENLKAISFSEQELKLNCGGTGKLDVNADPAGYKLPELVWSSSDESVATVNEKGEITASEENEGEAVITAQTEDGSYVAQCKVTVRLSLMQRISRFFNKIIEAIRSIISRIGDLFNRG